MEENFLTAGGLKKISKQEQEEINKKLERKTGFFKRLIRICSQNPDLILLVLIVFFSCLAGYYICRLKLGMTIQEIKLEVLDFIEFTTFILVTAVTFVSKLFVKQGVISRELSNSTQKPSDLTGRSLID